MFAQHMVTVNAANRWGSGSCCIHSEVYDYEVNAFYAEVFSFFFMSHGHLALNVTSGNSSDQ